MGNKHKIFPIRNSSRCRMNNQQSHNYNVLCIIHQAKQKYRGIFEIQKSGNKTSSGEIGLNIRTLASPEVEQDQVSGGVSVLCWHAASVANVLWKSLTIR